MKCESAPKAIGTFYFKFGSAYIRTANAEPAFGLLRLSDVRLGLSVLSNEEIGIAIMERRNAAKMEKWRRI